MKRLLWREYWRLTWHGYPDSFDTYLDLPLLDRFLCNDELNDLIRRTDSPRPSEMR